MTRSSWYIALSRPVTSSTLKITDWFFWILHASAYMGISLALFISSTSCWSFFSSLITWRVSKQCARAVKIDQEVCSGICRIFIWRGPYRWPEGRVVPLPAWRGGYAPSPENFWLFNFEMVYFDAHLRYSDVLIIKFCIATFSWINVHEYNKNQKKTKPQIKRKSNETVHTIHCYETTTHNS